MQHIWFYRCRPCLLSTQTTRVRFQNQTLSLSSHNFKQFPLIHILQRLSDINCKFNKVQHLPAGVMGVNFSLSSCVGDTLLLLLLLCGDDNVDTAFPCESIVRTDELSVVAEARGAPQKFKSNLLPVKRTSRSRRASRSLSKCNCKQNGKKHETFH